MLNESTLTNQRLKNYSEIRCSSRNSKFQLIYNFNSFVTSNIFQKFSCPLLNREQLDMGEFDVLPGMVSMRTDGMINVSGHEGVL